MERMNQSEVAKLRRQRRRIHAQLAKLEPLIEGYRAKLAQVEARILELDPQLWLPPRRYQPNAIFARKKLPRLALEIMREAGEPLPVALIVSRALAMEGTGVPGSAHRQAGQEPAAQRPPGAGQARGDGERWGPSYRPRCRVQAWTDPRTAPTAFTGS